MMQCFLAQILMEEKCGLDVGLHCSVGLLRQLRTVGHHAMSCWSVLLVLLAKVPILKARVRYDSPSIINVRWRF